MHWLLGILLLLSHFGTVYGSCALSCNDDKVQVSSGQKMDNDNSKTSKVEAMKLKKANKFPVKKNSTSSDVVCFSDIVQDFSNAVLAYNNGYLEKSKLLTELARIECNDIIKCYGDEVLNLYVYHHVSFREYKAKVDAFYIDKFDEGKKYKFSLSSMFEFLNPFSKDHEQ